MHSIQQTVFRDFDFTANELNATQPTAEVLKLNFDNFTCLENTAKHHAIFFVPVGNII